MANLAVGEVGATVAKIPTPPRKKPPAINSA
jgi:hypothetical protein